jgi:hypothetical protein
MGSCSNVFGIRAAKAAVLLSLVFFSGAVCATYLPGMVTQPAASRNTPGTPSPSTITLVRPTFLSTGKYLNYSFSFGLIPFIATTDHFHSTNMTGYLTYTMTSMGHPMDTIKEQTTHLNVNYGGGNSSAFIGYYSTASTNATIEANTVTAYTYNTATPYKHIGSTVQNASVSNVVAPLNFTTNINVQSSNGAYSSSTGNGTTAIILESALVYTDPRLEYWGSYRTLLSFYRNLTVLQINPNGIYASNLTGPDKTFSKKGTTEIATAFGERAVVYVTDPLGGNRNETLYYDEYSGILLEAVLSLDSFPAGGDAVHQLIYQLISTNVNLTTSIPQPTNEFQTALGYISTFLSRSALNDTNNSLFFNQVSANGKTVENYSKVAQDQFEIMAGSGNALGYAGMHNLMASVNQTLYDTLNNTYFVQVTNGTIDPVRTVTDAAWAILATHAEGAAAAHFQANMTEFMAGLYVNANGFHVFARDNSSLDQFYAYDNLIALLALETIDFDTNFTTSPWLKSIQAQALEMSANIISLFCNPSNPAQAKFLNDSLFYTEINEDGTPINKHKETEDAALAMIDISEWYLYNQENTTVSSYMPLIENTLSRLLRYAWNSTSGGFIEALDVTNHPYNSVESLETNTWAMYAGLELLQAVNTEQQIFNPTQYVANLTYYDFACNTWNAIQKLMFDPVNKIYLNSTASSNQVSAGSLGLLLTPLAIMLQYSQSTSISLQVINATNDYPAVGSTFTFESPKPQGIIQATWTFHLVVASTVGYSVNLLFNIPMADATFRLLYPNGTQYDSLLNVTNLNGVADDLFNLPNPPSFELPSDVNGSAQEAVVAMNRTGFQPVSAMAKFWVQSCIGFQFQFSPATIPVYESNGSVVNVPEIFPGQSFNAQINFTNIATTEQVVNVSFGQGGDILAPFSTLQELNGSIINETHTYTLTMLENISTGLQYVNFTVSKNSSNFYEAAIAFFIESPVFISNLNYSQYIVDVSVQQLSMTIKNLNPAETVHVMITFISQYLIPLPADQNQNVTIVSLSQAYMTIHFKLNSSTLGQPLPEYTFELEIWINGIAVGITPFSIYHRPGLEIQSISGPTNPIQGNMMLFGVSVQNNYATPVQATIQVLRVMADNSTVLVDDFTRTLQPGQNNLILQVNPGITSPWDTGQREYRVSVILNGTEVARGTVIMTLQISVGNALLGYVLPFAVIGVVILLALYKKNQIMSVRR